jgi:carbamoyl-phosphate synthase large subunit
VLIRPSYVLGGRAMRVCYRPEDVRDALDKQTLGRVLMDRFLENAIEIDVDALCDGETTHICAVMQHVEEAGVHSGDSACVLPAPSLTAAAAAEIQAIVRRLGPALGAIGLLNVQLAVADGQVYVLEVNPRASRTVPFASKATGVNMVQAACRLAAGEKLADLGLAPEHEPAQVSVKAAVLPFARFPGADPVLGPEMRSTGEAMGLDRDYPIAFAKSQLGSGALVPTSGTVFVSVRDADKVKIVGAVKRLEGLGFRVIATSGTQRYLGERGIACAKVNKVLEGRPHIVDAIKNGEVQLVFNTTEGAQALSDSRSLRRAALLHKVPYYTTIAGAVAVSLGIEAYRAGSLEVRPLQSYFASAA